MLENLRYNYYCDANKNKEIEYTKLINTFSIFILVNSYLEIKIE